MHHDETDDCSITFCSPSHSIIMVEWQDGLMAQLRISRNDFNVVPVPHQAIPAYSLNFISVQALLIPQVDPEVLCIYWKPGLTSQLVIDLPFFLLLWQSLRHQCVHFAIGLICLASDASQLIYLPPLACTFCAYVITSVHYSHFVSTWYTRCIHVPFMNLSHHPIGFSGHALDVHTLSRGLLSLSLF